MNLFVFVFLTFLITANSYLAYKFINAFRGYLPLPVWSVVIIWIFLALAGIIFRNESSVLPASITDVLYTVGAYWIAMIFYGLLIVVFCDIVALILNLAKINVLRFSPQLVGGGVITIIFALMLYGSYNASNPVPVYYKIQLDKAAKEPSMRIVLISDMHLGRINDAVLTKKASDIINDLKPDIVFLAGDTIDSDLNSVIRKDSLAGFESLNVKYGIYAILGNHEYIGQNGELAVRYMESKKIKMLIDEGAELSNGVYVYGRDDFSKSRDKKRLPHIKDKPFIVVDHQPRRIKEASDAGAVMMLSGHTHRGQMFPNNLITKRMYEIDYGHKSIDGIDVIVSSGLGTWGPPVRIGSRSEVVCIDVSFK